MQKKYEVQSEKKCTKRMVFRNIKCEDKIWFSLLYVTMVAIELDSVLNIDIQEQDQDNITVMFLWS
jgi:hypothetical protein